MVNMLINHLWYLITYTNNGKVFHNINLAKKNLYLCQDSAESSKNEEHSKTYLWNNYK
jgi:REP element-mobilizing transposase RayT